MPSQFQDPVVVKIAAFLNEIGIRVRRGAVDDSSFLPGIKVVRGDLIVDESKLSYPGDLLHEAGHLAVVPARLRPGLSGMVSIEEGNPDVIEAAAMSSSYAACLHLGLDPRIVFHENGYHGRSANLLFNFKLGVFPGLHELVAAGMTCDGGSPGHEAFPAMQKWLRD